MNATILATISEVSDLEWSSAAERRGDRSIGESDAVEIAAVDVEPEGVLLRPDHALFTRALLFLPMV